VVRVLGDKTAICGVFPTPEGADAFCGACKQEWEDKKLPMNATFEVVLATYYDA
jgi:hypothetical protein